jgi:hypothetical protein
VTPDRLEREHTLATAVARLDALRARESFAVTPDELVADGVLAGPGVFRDTLSADEALELLALTEVVARKASYGRQLTVRSARAAGASWAQIGTALGTSRQAAWETHRRWLAATGDEPADDTLDDAPGDGPDDVRP